MRRIGLAVVLAVSLILVPLAAEAEQAGRVYRIGVLSAEVLPPRLLQSFQEGLRELGYDEGKNLAIESRDAGGKNERLAALADELVQLKVDIILTVNTPPSQAAKNATATIPIVITRVADPIKSGLVPTLAHPGGNLTGVSSSSVDSAPKQIQLESRRSFPALLAWPFSGMEIILPRAWASGRWNRRPRRSVFGLYAFPCELRAISPAHFRLQPKIAPKRWSSSRMYGSRSTGLRPSIWRQSTGCP